MITSAQLNLHGSGVPPASVPRYEKVARAAIKAGCSIHQARCIAIMTYHAAAGFYWNLPAGSGIEIHTRFAQTEIARKK